MSKPAKSKKRQAKAGASSVREEKGITMEDAMAAPNVDVNAQPPKEFSDNLQQLKFMARRSNASQSSSSSFANASTAAQPWQLPETTLADSLYHAGINVPVPIVLRKGLEFARDSDAVLEIAMLQSRNKRLKGDEPSGKFFITKGEKLDEGGGEGDEDNVDDAALAKHFAKQKKQQQKRHNQRA